MVCSNTKGIFKIIIYFQIHKLTQKKKLQNNWEIIAFVYLIVWAMNLRNLIFLWGEHKKCACLNWQLNIIEHLFLIKTMLLSWNQYKIVVASSYPMGGIVSGCQSMQK